MALKFKLIILCLLQVICGTSQNVNDLSFTNIDADKFKCKSIIRTRLGSKNQMWLITDLGLASYNGYKTTHYRFKKDTKNSPLSLLMQSLFVDKKGMVWFGYNDHAAVSCFDPETESFKHYEHDSLNKHSFPKDDIVSNIKEDSQGNMWVTTWGAGILLFDKEKKGFSHINILTNKKDMPTNVVRDFYELEKNKYVVTFFEEKYLGETVPRIFNAETKTFSPFPFQNYFKNLDKEMISSIELMLTICHFFHKDNFNNYWFGTYSGLIMLDNKTMTAKRVSGKTFTNTFINLENTTSYIIDEQDRMLTNTGNSGIMVVDLKTQKTFYHKRYNNCANCVADNSVKSFTKDNDGNIWITNGSGKLSIYEPLGQQFKLKTWENLKMDFVDPSGWAMPVNCMVSRKGNLMYLSSLNGISVYNFRTDSLQDLIQFAKKNESEAFRNSVQGFKFYNQHIISNTCLQGGQSSFATLVTYNLKTKRIVDINFDIINHPVRFKNDSLSTPILMDDKFYEYSLKKNKIDKTFELKKMNTSYRRYTEILKNGKWFVDDYKAFVIFDPVTKKETRYASKKPCDRLFADSNITGYYYNKKNTVWITTKSGIFSYDQNTELITNWTKKLATQNLYIQGIIEDTVGNVWYTTSKDLYKCNFNTKHIYKFTKAIGLKGDGFNHLERIFEMGFNNGTLFFPTNNGLLFFDPSKINYITTKPKVFVYNITLNDTDLLKHERETFLKGLANLKYDENTLVFELATNQLHTPIINKFKFNLKGRNDKWIDNETSNKIIFQNLPAGDYTLNIICINGYNIESSVFSVPFTINKPFWKTWWFILLFLSGTGGLIVCIIKQREKSFKSKKNELEKMVSERTKEVVKQKEIIEEKQKELTDSIKYAQRIQNALLASKSLLDAHLNNYFIYYNPKDIVSGDFYWATSFNKKFYFIVADSTGHGVPGAFMSLLNINLLNEAINEKQIIEPGLILDYVRKRLIQNLSEDGSLEGGKDGMDCSLLCIDFENNNLQYACAYNAILIVRNGKLIELLGDRMPVGKSPKEHTNFTTNHFNLQKNDTIYIFTDGFADQFGGENGKKMKVKKLKELIINAESLGVDNQKIELEKYFKKWMGSLEQLDDVCVVGIKI